MNSLTKKQSDKMVEDHYRKFNNKLVKMLTKKAGNRQNAEDTVQEAYTRALTYIKSYDGKSDFGAWFNTILVNALSDNKVEVRNNGQTGDRCVESIEDHIKGNVLDKIQNDEILTAIKAKTDSVKKILTLYFFHQYKPREIALVVPQTGYNIRKIVQRFKEEMASEHNETGSVRP